MISNFQEHIYLSHEIREFYFKDAAIDRSVLKQYIDLLSDMNFDYGIHKAARQHAAKTNSKAFFYRYFWQTLRSHTFYLIIFFKDLQLIRDWICWSDSMWMSVDCLALAMEMICATFFGIFIFCFLYFYQLKIF